MSDYPSKNKIEPCQFCLPLHTSIPLWGCYFLFAENYRTNWRQFVNHSLQIQYLEKYPIVLIAQILQMSGYLTQKSSPNEILHLKLLTKNLMDHQIWTEKTRTRFEPVRKRNYRKIIVGMNGTIMRWWAERRCLHSGVLFNKEYYITGFCCYRNRRSPGYR